MIEDVLEREEGCRLSAYQDQYGWWTIGFGTLIDGRKGGGISRAAALFMLREKVAEIEGALDRRLSWWRGLDETRREVLLSMAYQLGVSGLLGFGNTLASVALGNYGQAADEMLASRWAAQTPERAARAATAMRTGAWPTA